MPKKSRSFQRSLGERRYRRMFLVVSEGEKTEPEYFRLLGKMCGDVSVRCVGNLRHKSAPQHLLSWMEEKLKNESMKESDEAWLVVDRDQWNKEHLEKLCRWTQNNKDTYAKKLAISNPKFEYWLLLHFENGAKSKTAKKCIKKLQQYCPQYDKGITKKEFTLDLVKDAMQHAKEQDKPRCNGVPRQGITTVYRLVERILQAQEEAENEEAGK